MSSHSSTKHTIRKFFARFLVVVGIVSGVTALYIANLPETSYETKEEPIKFTTQTFNDENLRRGVKEVRREGQNGLKEVKYEIKTKNGKEISRKPLSTKTITEPVTQAIALGTKDYYMCSNGVEDESAAEKNECEKRVSWEKTRNSALAECYADSSKTNCWFDEYPGTYIHWTDVAPPRSSYNPGSSFGRTGAICRDGWRSYSTGRGTCSHHGGVSYWLY